MTDWTAERVAPERAKRGVARAMARGARGRCPHCGEGRLFDGYLKVRHSCEACGEAFFHHRADDAPPYFTMLIVGHLLVPLMLVMQLATDLSNATYLAIWLPLTLIATLGLLRPVKGAIVGLQWALYIHGFDGSADPDAPQHGFAGDRS